MERGPAKAVRDGLAWLLWGGGLILVIYGALNTTEGPWGVVQLTLGGVSFGVVGLILAVHTRSVMGWLFLVTQVLMAVILSPIDTSGSELMIMITWILLVFPSGEIPSSRWKVAVWSLSIATLAWLLFDLTEILHDENYAWLVFMALTMPVLVGSAIRVVNDYRTSVGETRQQLKWLAWVFLIGGTMLLVSMIPVPYVDDAHDLAGVVLMVGSPVAIGLAISRYRLYEIDRIISQTLSYTAILLILGLFFAVGAIWIPQALGVEEPLAVAASTLAVAAGFNPIRRRVRSVVDRRFNRSKYDHELIVEGFSASLRDTVDQEELLSGWLGVVVETMHPRSISVWTRLS